MWREMPIGRTLHTRMWRVAASEIPRDSDAQTQWLYDWWKRIDAWVESHQ
jgi:hypothetical protein